MKNTYLLATLSLLGCFGAQDQSSSTGSGTAMDGYLFGSTVFIDYDEDGIHDDDEPSGITDELGKSLCFTKRKVWACVESDNG